MSTQTCRLFRSQVGMSPSKTLSSVIGTFRTRTPVALNTAFAMTAPGSAVNELACKRGGLTCADGVSILSIFETSG